jgi:hypothetical protein
MIGSFRFLKSRELNIVAEWLALLFYILEVCGSDLSPEKAIMTEVCHGFPQSL